MSKLKTAKVIFADEKYNYSTSVSGKLLNDEIINYFKGTFFNLGSSTKDDMQLCVNCVVEPFNP